MPADRPHDPPSPDTPHPDPARTGPPDPALPHPELEEATVAGLGAALAEGMTTSVDLVTAYLARIEAIDRGDIDLRSIIVVNPAAAEVAAELDAERAAGRARGPLHGIPVLVKDNIDTDPEANGGMATTAGSLALADPAGQPTGDATVVTRLREAGAIILGKTNLSEWANFRSTTSSSGWSGVGGPCRNPYVLDRSPCGSSSGSGAAVAANLAAAALGTETNGSIVCPASANGLVGIKPTVGLTSRAGVVPISHGQDTVGPMARTVADAAAVLGALVGVDERDPATATALAALAAAAHADTGTANPGHANPDYTSFLDPDGLRGARLGVARQFLGRGGRTTTVFESVLVRLAELGAELVDPVDFPSHDELVRHRPDRDVLVREFRTDLAAYLATRRAGPRTVADLIDFNTEHANRELAWFGQELFELAQERGGTDHPDYRDDLSLAQNLARAEGLDAVLDGGAFGGAPLDAVIAPTMGPAWPIDLVNGDPGGGGSSHYAAVAGYPLVTVPMGQVFGLPVGITFMGRAWSEPTLIRLASGFEAAIAARRPPRFIQTLGLGPMPG